MEKLLIVLLINVYSLLSVTFSSNHKELARQTPREILIETPGLMFNPARIKVEPGELIKITLKNTDEMSHDFVLTQPKQRERVVALATAMTSDPNETGFIPSTPLIINSIPLLHPGEQKSITFKAPEREGIYPYVCTYPGHGSIMYGAMYVTTTDLPAIETDLNIPSGRRKSDVSDHSMMHMPMKMVTMYRTFMPESGPAGIAVSMPGDINYNWDAGACRFRYAWSGGFLDLDKNWAGNGKNKAEIIGTIFYREKTKDPIRIGTKAHIPTHQFKGYTLVNSYPTFKYKLDNVNVSERITPATEVQGFIRTFTFTNLTKPLWFVKDEADAKPTATGGKWTGNYCMVTPKAGTAKLVLTFKKP